MFQAAGQPSAAQPDGEALNNNSWLGSLGSNGPSESDDWTCGLSRWQRVQVFFLFMAAAVLLLGMALFVFLPMALMFPGKFAMCFTVGSICFMVGFAMLRGPRSMATQLFAADRAAFTGAYLGSMALTLYATFVSKAYLLIMFSTAVQCAALAWYGASYIPGGSAGMAYLSTACWRLTGSAARGVVGSVSAATSQSNA